MRAGARAEGEGWGVSWTGWGCLEKRGMWTCVVVHEGWHERDRAVGGLRGIGDLQRIGDLTECKPVPAHTHHPAFDSHPYLSLAVTRTCPHCAGAGMIGLLRSYDPSRSD